MTEREMKVAELSQQLTMSFEQMQGAKRQEQLALNQLSKTKIVMGEVEKSKGSMYRSLGRMFVLSTAEDLKKELENEIARRTNAENELFKMRNSREYSYTKN